MFGTLLVCDSSRMSVENRESFFQRLYPFFSPKILRDIELAYILAKAAHRSQTRKERDEHGEPVRYFEHVRRATLIGIDLAQIVRPDTVIVSILHDGIEDTRDLRPEMIEHVFGADVCGIVKVLSKDPKAGYLDRFYVCTDWRPYFIKACDRLDNLHSMADATVEFRKKQVAETRDKYFRLFDRMVTLTPDEYHDGVRRLREQIIRTTAEIPLD